VGQERREAKNEMINLPKETKYRPFVLREEKQIGLTTISFGDIFVKWLA
jgi:hypothetical protein